MRTPLHFLLAAAALGLVFVLFVVPTMKVIFDCVIATITGFSAANLVAQHAPLYCRCCGTTIYKAHYRSAGKIFTCPDCSTHRLHIPKLTLPQVLKQNFPRIILEKSLDEIAFSCKARPKGKPSAIAQVAAS